MSAVLRVQEGQLSVEAPAIDISAADLIRNSGVPTEVLAWAHSCHVAEYACGVCRGCLKHYQTLEALGLDPY
jgi:7-cyano-7-deazaguanine synthase